MLKRPTPLFLLALLCSLALALALALTLAACGNSQSPGATNAPPGGTGNTNNTPTTTVTMTQNGFAQSSVTIKEGQTVDFTNDPTGNERTLCIGQNGVCQQGAQGPSNLTQGGGMLLRPGASKDVTFDTPGTYHLTSTNQGAINLTVIVKSV